MTPLLRAFTDYLLNLVRGLLAVAAVAVVDAAVRSRMATTTEDAALPWTQFSYGMSFLVGLSPIVIGVPATILTILAARFRRKGAIAMASAVGAALGSLLSLAAQDLRPLLLLGAMGLAFGIAVRVPPRREASPVTEL